MLTMIELDMSWRRNTILIHRHAGYLLAKNEDRYYVCSLLILRKTNKHNSYRPI